MQGYPTLMNLAQWRKGFSTTSLKPLSLLQGGRTHRVTEPVDRIYGLLGLIKEWTKEEIVVDYSAEARIQYWRLYISVTKLLVRLCGLKFLTIAASEERPPQLPSWVLNWNSYQLTTEVATHFHADFNHKHTTKLEDILIPGSNSIQLRGFQIGTILSTSALEYKHYRDSEEHLGSEGAAARTLSMMDEAYANYRSLCHEPEDILFSRFARTLVADTGSMSGSSDHEYVQNPHEDYVWYRAYLSDCKYNRWGRDVAASEQKRRENVSPYAMNLPTQWRNRSFFVTDSGRIGLCSQSCRPGDVVCIFLSAKHTYILRKVPDKTSFTLVSCAYTDEVMYGEALDTRDPAKDEIFIID